MGDFSLLQEIALLLLGAGLGLFGGLFGIGGGIIAVPIFIAFFGESQAMSQGTALVMMVPNLLLAWWRYMKHNPVPGRDAVGVAVVGTLTTWAMAHFAQDLDQATLRALFALFLLWLAVRMIRAKSGSPAKARLPRKLLPLVGLAGGSSMGLLGIGGGLVATPLCSWLFGLEQRQAQSLGLTLVTPSSVMALYTYAGHGNVDWPLGLPLALGGMLTVAAGVALAHRLPERKMQLSFGIMLLFTGLWLLGGRFLMGGA